MKFLPSIKPLPLEVRSVPARIYNIGLVRPVMKRPPSKYSNESHEELLQRYEKINWDEIRKNK